MNSIDALTPQVTPYLQGKHRLRSRLFFVLTVSFKGQPHIPNHLLSRHDACRV